MNITKKLKRLGFKKKWLIDKSGYWIEKKVGKHFTYYIDADLDQYFLTHKHDEGNGIEFKNIKKLLKSFKKFKFKY